MTTSGADFSRPRDVDGWVSPLFGVGIVALLLMAAGCGAEVEGGVGEVVARLTADGGGDDADGGAAPEVDAAMHEHPAPAPDDDAGSADPESAAADEHCDMDMPPDPRDSLIESSDPVVWTSDSSKSQDVLLPQQVIDWMDEQELQEAHGAWHATRAWDSQCGESNASADDCSFAEGLIYEDLWRAEYQQGAPGAGLAFLHMHRHMIHMFRTAFPLHSDLFDGWTHIPRTTDDPENPTPWHEIEWTDEDLFGFDILENIEAHLAEFPTEDDLGLFIESSFRWTPEDPVVSLGLEGSGVHASLHNQWAVSRSPGNLGRTDQALPNYIFWKLHGFIDDVWTRYRIAKRLHDEDLAYRTVARYECRLMYYLEPAHRPEPPPASDTDLKRGH